jgi:hypothetical protein
MSKRTHVVLPDQPGQEQPEPYELPLASMQEEIKRVWLF